MIASRASAPARGLGRSALPSLGTGARTAVDTAPVAEGRRSSRRWVAGLVALGVVTALVAGSASYALWSASNDVAGGTVTAGDLSLTVGTATWEQVTPGVTNGASGELSSTAPDFLSMPGDVIEIVQPVTTTLVGDNLAAGLHVDFADAEAGNSYVDDGLIAISFHIEDDTGTQVAPASGQAQFGDVVPVPGLVGDDDGETATWNVVITVDVLGDYVWATDRSQTAAGGWGIGALTVDLAQVRTGSGFTGGP